MIRFEASDDVGCPDRGGTAASSAVIEQIDRRKRISSWNVSIRQL